MQHDVLQMEHNDEGIIWYCALHTLQACLIEGNIITNTWIITNKLVWHKQR